MNDTEILLRISEQIGGLIIEFRTVREELEEIRQQMRAHDVAHDKVALKDDLNNIGKKVRFLDERITKVEDAPKDKAFEREQNMKNTAFKLASGGLIGFALTALGAIIMQYIQGLNK